MDLLYLQTHWALVRTGLVETISKFNDAELDFKPFPTFWSVRQLMLHIAQEELGEFNYGITQTLMEFPPDYPPVAYPTVESILALLESVHAPIHAYVENLEEAELGRTITTPWGASYTLLDMLGHLIEHEIHHRAELSLILGMLGREGLNA
ncbi:MAG: DinB family protein [Caldilineaceae bacterium]